MSWTRTVPPAEAAGGLKDLYAEIAERSSHRQVSNLWQALALDPPGLAAGFVHLRALMDDPAPLTRAQAELIALVVSATNGCGYCVAHHGLRLIKAGVDEALARAVAIDYREANLAARDRVLLDAVVALTCEPDERKLDDIERVREYGFDDPAIVRALAIAGYFAYANRMVLGLGVTLEAGLTAWEFGAQR